MNYENFIDENMIRDNYDIVIFEGFDHVGKTYIKDMIKDSNICKYHSITEFSSENYKDLNVKYIDRYKLGILVARVYNQVLESLSSELPSYTQYPPMLMLDRSLASTLMYNKFYSQGSFSNSHNDIINMYKSEIFNRYRVLIIHVSHYDIDSMKMIYESSMQGGKDLEEYDIFDNFLNYKDDYLEAESIYKEVYNNMHSEGLKFDLLRCYNKYEGGLVYAEYSL